ncbi:MAG: GNAT family N-acetyltransferase [Anaerolineae bacterium]|nr:GNAT family N-acetyltransferase [Anaerolineae bacterium]
MTLSLRPFDYSDADYEIALAINAAVFNEPPDPLAVWRHDDETHDQTYAFYRDLVLRDGAVIAYVETYQNQYAFHPQKYECRIFVHPAHDAPDVRPFVLDYTLDRLRDRDLIALTSGMLDDKPEAMRFFEEYGFVRVAEEKLSRLDVMRFDPAAHAETLARVRAGGIEIVTLRALQARDPGWQRKLYDLDVTVNRDIPSTGEKHYRTFEEWLTWRLDSPTCDPEGWFVALAGDHYVGQSQGNINRAGDVVQFITGVTSTRREYRRRGIATALKLHVIAYARAQGAHEIFTTNDSQNPMYRLNLALGFAPLPSWVRVEKSLVGEKS